MKFPIFLLKPEPTDLFELNFSYNFCQRYLRKYVSQDIRFITGEETLSQLNPASNLIWIVFDPTCVPAKTTKEKLIQAIDLGYDLVCPVANESVYDCQRIRAPFVYHDLATFNELAEFLAKDNQNDLTEVRQLEPYFICLNLKKVPMEIVIKDIAQLNLKKCVVKNALVHRFKNIFSSPRSDILALIPEQCKTILDLGCGHGTMGKHLKTLRPYVRITGVEISPSLAQEAKKYYDQVYVQDLNKTEIKDVFDLVICGDILEHLYDPWTMIKKIGDLLKENGYFIGSIPNVAHYSILKELLKGKFEYVPSGLLCVGHIRFFTEESLKRVLGEVGFKVDKWINQKVEPTPEGKKFIEQVQAFANQEQLETISFLFRAQKQ